MLHSSLLDILSPITTEEQRILSGEAVDKSLYMQQDNIISAKKLLQSGRLITFRPHTRFAHFPAHRHDYVEMVYMCSGQTTHIVDGKTITLQKGELLILAQHTTQEILPAGQEDIAVNFIVLPEFFEQVLPMLGEKDAPLRRFLLHCLSGEESGIPYLHFTVSNLIPAQNLIENLLFTFLTPSASRRQLQQTTMGLLFLLLLSDTEYLSTPSPSGARLMEIHRYVEEHYKDGSLTELAEAMHLNPAFLCRLIPQLTGHTYTELQQEKRLSRAAFLLTATTRNVDDIARSVGYDNVSYFHRLFKKNFSLSPGQYRTMSNKDTFSVK